MAWQTYYGMTGTWDVLRACNADDAVGAGLNVPDAMLIHQVVEPIVDGAYPLWNVAGLHASTDQAAMIRCWYCGM
jgi:hypothetical protein